jgi:hypothetical protein
MATPNDMPATDPLAGIQASDQAKATYVDPTPIYQPALEFIDKQRTQANERYAQNKADISNLFGQLTQVNKESQARVNQQFTESIANQQMQTAQRIAEARTGAAQTQASALRAMDERGGGPMSNLAASPVAVEAERGIARQGALQEIFAGQQGAIQQQTIQNLTAAQQGYGQQQLQAEQGLQRNLEDVLMGLAGQETGVRTNIAEAIYGGKSNVAQAGYNEYLTEQANQQAIQLANARGYWDTQQAQINAASKLAVAEANAKNRVTNYPSTSAGVTQFMRNEGADDSAISRFWASVDSADIAGATNSQEAFAAWKASNNVVGPKGRIVRGPSAGEQAAARLYFDGLRYNQPDTANALIPQYDWSTLPGSTLPNTGR